MGNNITVAQQELSKARLSVVSAMRSISAIVVDECSGYDELSSTSIAGLSDVLVQLISIKCELDRRSRKEGAK